MHALGIDEAYRVERVLARGGAGVTERVTIDGVGPFVRKKIPLARANRGVWAVLPECDSLRLPRVAVTYELPDCFVAVYDFIPGDSLEHVVHAAGGLEPEQAVELLGQICDAVGSLHTHGIIHRDITPGNVIVAADGAHLIDLGNAKLKGQGVEDGEHPLGTVGFAAPEQFGFAQTDERSDVYSIGRLLGFMLMGEAALRTARLVLPEEGGPVPAGLRAVIERACAFEPSARYQTTSELAAAVRACGGNGKVESQRDSIQNAPASAAPAQTRGSRKRSVAIASLAIACAVALIVVVMFLIPRLMQPAADTVPSSQGEAAERKGDRVLRDGSDALSESNTDDPLSDSGGGENEYNLLEVVESGWSVSSSDEVSFAVSVKNTDAAKTVYTPNVNITGYTTDGSVAFATSCGVGYVMPGQTVWMAGSAFASGAVSRVEFTPEPSPSGFVSENAMREATYTVSKLTEKTRFLESSPSQASLRCRRSVSWARAGIRVLYTSSSCFAMRRGMSSPAAPVSRTGFRRAVRRHRLRSACRGFQSMRTWRPMPLRRRPVSAFFGNR